MCMKRIMSVLALTALASTAHAGSDKQSFFQCGVKLGGTEVAYSGSQSSKTQERKQVTYRTGLLGSDASGISELARAKTRQVEKRLPLTVTVAQFGCSW